MIETTDDDHAATVRQHDQLLYGVPDAARVLGVGRTTVYSLLASGEVESVRIGNRRLIPADAIEEYVTRLRAAVGSWSSWSKVKSEFNTTASTPSSEGNAQRNHAEPREDVRDRDGELSNKPNTK
jgi:excisionase family DNA binding protein